MAISREARIKANLIRSMTQRVFLFTLAELAEHVAPLTGLQSRHGTFFVTGNHEYHSGAHAWIKALRRLGLTVLMNEHVVHHQKSRRCGW